MTTPHLSPKAQAVIKQITQFRELDAPTHGGRVLSYVYDSGLAELDELAAQAARAVQSVNGLDPTTFPSVAMMERDVLGFVRDALNGDNNVVGNVTSGGTESCLLAVKTARDLWRATHQDTPAHQTNDTDPATPRGTSARTTPPTVTMPRLVAPATVHAAFHKAAAYFDLVLDLVDVDPTTGAVNPADVIDRLADDVALVVLSAPNYPYAQLDPIADVATATHAANIPLHVDACIGGLALPWWPGLTTPWDFRVPGVTSISADLHKYGYAPKGISVILHRGPHRHRHQYFAVTAWPGYPVVNPTLLGSKSPGPLAAAWAIITYLGTQGFTDLTAATHRATTTLTTALNRIEGLTIQGTPTGPLFALVEDTTVPPNRRVNPHLLVDAARTHGWILQAQPGAHQRTQPDLPQSAHLTITPVTEHHTHDLITALTTAADTVRGTPSPLTDPDLHTRVTALINTLTEPTTNTTLTTALTALGINPTTGDLPNDLSHILAYAQLLPAPIAEQLLTEILALLVTPTHRKEPDEPPHTH